MKITKILKVLKKYDVKKVSCCAYTFVFDNIKYTFFDKNINYCNEKERYTIHFKNDFLYITITFDKVEDFERRLEFSFDNHRIASIDYKRKN